MKRHYAKESLSTDALSDHPIKINNCGYFEDITDMTVHRPMGRMDYQLIYIQKGEMEFLTDSGKQTLGEGSVWLYRPNIPQHYRVSGSASFCWIHFTGTAISDFLSFFEADCYHVGAFTEFERFCRECYFPSPFAQTGMSELVYQGKLITLFGRIADVKHSLPKNRSEDFSKIRDAVSYIHEHYRERPDNARLASTCNMSKYYFIKTFEKAVGLPPQQYCAALIITKSRELLENSNYSIGEIATYVGIEDSLYFSRLFKKHVGVSPTEYRKK